MNYAKKYFRNDRKYTAGKAERKTFGRSFPALVLAKVVNLQSWEFCNKSRMALKMIEDAEKDGRLKPGGTIIEGTYWKCRQWDWLSAANYQRLHKCIFVTNSKQSKEKAEYFTCFQVQKW